MRIEGQNGNRIQRIKRVQRVADIKPNLYYTKRGLTKDDQTAEISTNLRDGKGVSNITSRELFDIESARSQNSRIYNKLQEAKTEQDKVREFKSGYKAEGKSNAVVEENQKDDIQKDEEER